MVVKNQNRMVGWIVVIGIFLALAGTCRTERSTGRDTDSTSSSGNASSRVACTHLRNVADDFSDGILTGPELRTKFQEIVKTSSGSDVPELADAARDVLAGLTSGDLDSAASGLGRLGRACESIGH